MARGVDYNNYALNVVRHTGIATVASGSANAIDPDGDDLSWHWASDDGTTGADRWTIVRAGFPVEPNR